MVRAHQVFRRDCYRDYVRGEGLSIETFNVGVFSLWVPFTRTIHSGYSDASLCYACPAYAYVIILSITNILAAHTTSERLSDSLYPV